MYRTKHHRPFRMITMLSAAALSLGAITACGSDDPDESKLSQAACDAAVDFGAAFGQAPQEPDAFKGFAADTLVPIGNRLVENFEGPTKSSAETLSKAFTDIAATGDPSVLEAPTALAAQAAIGSAVHGQCDLQAVNISAVEYAFVDAPSSLKAGRVSFALENKGVEDHEMVLFKRADGVTDSLDDILAMSEDEMGSKMTFTGVTFGSPKTTNYVAVDIEPGTYFLLCFIPQGGGEDGPPHFMAGMKQTIEVT